MHGPLAMSFKRKACSRAAPLSIGIRETHSSGLSLRVDIRDQSPKAAAETGRRPFPRQRAALLPGLTMVRWLLSCLQMLLLLGMSLLQLLGLLLVPLLHLLIPGVTGPLLRHSLVILLLFLLEFLVLLLLLRVELLLLLLVFLVEFCVSCVRRIRAWMRCQILGVKRGRRTGNAVSWPRN